MANTSKSKSKTEQYQNGAAKDIIHDVEKVGRKTASALGLGSEELQGYAFLTAGTLLFLHTLGYFAILNWILMVGAIALMLYGAKLVDLLEKSQEVFFFLKDKFTKK